MKKWTLDIKNIGKGFGDSIANTASNEFKSTFNIKSIWKKGGKSECIRV